MCVCVCVCVGGGVRSWVGCGFCSPVTHNSDVIMMTSQPHLTPPSHPFSLIPPLPPSLTLSWRSRFAPLSTRSARHPSWPYSAALWTAVSPSCRHQGYTRAQGGRGGREGNRVRGGEVRWGLGVRGGVGVGVGSRLGRVSRPKVTWGGQRGGLGCVGVVGEVGGLGC